MKDPERYARGAVITALGGGAGWISLSHVYKFVMQHSAPGTHWSTGVIVAAVSELMPLGVMLHVRGQKAAGKVVSKLAWAMLLLAGAFSLWAQIATADPGVTGWAVAAFPTLAFMGLVKLMLTSTKSVRTAQPARAVVRTEPSVESSTEAGTPQIGLDPAATTGEVAAGPGVDATPISGRRSGRSASRAVTTAKVRTARQELEAKLGRKATQAEVGRLAGCSTATVSRIESQPKKLAEEAESLQEDRPILNLAS